MSYPDFFSPDKVAVITGAADGIGLAAARRYAELGMHVVMADIHAEKLDAAAGTIQKRSPGQRLDTQVIDVAQFTTLTVLKDHVYAEFGRVDVLMNNAGTSLPTTAWSALAQWRQTLDVNLMGIIHGIQAFTQAMIDQGTPAVIINTGSKQGITNPPGNPAYNVSKAGVKSATEALEHALRNTPDCQVRAHLLIPGYTFTGLTFLGQPTGGTATQPPGAWLPAQVINYMLDAITRGSFYILCPDNEVTHDDDARRILWAAGDLAHDRPPLSRWHPEYKDAFAKFNS